MFEAVESLIAEHAELEDVLADPSLHADQARARKVNQRYAELSAIVRTYRDPVTSIASRNSSAARARSSGCRRSRQSV